MKVSIITVCFNSANTIRRTFDSIFSQDYKNIEYIVIDGGSTDSTLQIISEYSDKISILVSEPDNGIYDAMNKGLKVATGEIICFLNSDDEYINNGILSRVVDLIRLKSIDALYADLIYVDRDNLDKATRYYTSKYFSPKVLCYGITPAHPTLFLKKNIYELYGYFDENYKIAGDFEFIARIFIGGKLNYYYLKEPIIKMQNGGISTLGFKSAIIINLEIINACKKLGINTSFIKIFSRYILKVFEFLPH